MYLYYTTHQKDLNMFVLLLKFAILLILAPYAFKEFVLFVKFTIPVPDAELFKHLGKTLIAFYACLCILAGRLLGF